MHVDFLKKLSQPKFRWLALVDISLGLAIVVIDNTILNVSIPYILRDLKTQFSNIQWIISGYSLVIATTLITASRVADIWGRKRIFIVGIVIFMAGSFLGSTAQNAPILILGRAVIQAVGAACMLPSALSLINTTFSGKERALAFGIWGSVAGAAASIGPLLGGYLTTYLSWRWSLRINIIVGIIAILASVFISESYGKKKSFDWVGTFLSGLGLFAIDFSIIEGNVFGWITPKIPVEIFQLRWPFSNISIIPVLITVGVILLIIFTLWELHLEKRGKSPLIFPQMFFEKGFLFGLITLLILAFGQFSAFFVVPIYLENVLNLSAFSAGLFLLSTSVSLFIFGTLSGIIARKISLKWIIVTGTFLLAIGNYLLATNVSTGASWISLSPGLVLIGIGFGLASSQLNNIIISSVDTNLTGEAAGTSTTFRQIGASMGVAIIGTIFAGTLFGNITSGIHKSTALSVKNKNAAISQLHHTDIESGNLQEIYAQLPLTAQKAVKKQVKQGIVKGSQTALMFGSYFVLASVFAALFLPRHGPHEYS